MSTPSEREAWDARLNAAKGRLHHLLSFEVSLKDFNRQASRTWGRRRDGADLPPLRRGQRPKPPVEPLQESCMFGWHIP